MKEPLAEKEKDALSELKAEISRRYELLWMKNFRYCNIFSVNPKYGIILNDLNKLKKGGRDYYKKGKGKGMRNGYKSKTVKIGHGDITIRKTGML